MQQPVRQGGQAIGGDAHQFKLLAASQRGGERGQAVAGQHQFLQVGAIAQCLGQFGQAVVGEDQPAQPGWQGAGRYLFDTVGLEADNTQLRALANAGR
ncbi:hypothetical protein D3C80_1231640 [compost metagenome]